MTSKQTVDPRPGRDGGLHDRARRPGSIHRPEHDPPGPRRIDRDLEWTVNAYNLSFAVLLMTAAALGDRLGRRRVFAAGWPLRARLGGLRAGAHRGRLIAARAVQGAGAAAVMTLALALVGAAFPPERRGGALGIFFAVPAWRCWRPGGRRRGDPGHRLAVDLLDQRADRAGADSAGAEPDPGEPRARQRRSTCPAWRWSPAGSWAWSGRWCGPTAPAGESPEVLVALTAGGGAARRLRRVESCGPRSRCCRCASSARAPSRRATRRSSSPSASLFCGVFFMAQFLQAGLGYGPFGAGLRLLPWTATLFFVAPVAGTLVDRFGERPFMVAGPLLQATASAGSRWSPTRGWLLRR